MKKLVLIMLIFSFFASFSQDELIINDAVYEKIIIMISFLEMELILVSMMINMFLELVVWPNQDIYVNPLDSTLIRPITCPLKDLISI